MVKTYPEKQIEPTLETEVQALLIKIHDCVLSYAFKYRREIEQLEGKIRSLSSNDSDVPNNKKQ